jgi:hypothetical protein
MIVLTGVPVYFFWKKANQTRSGTGQPPAS